MDLKLQGKVALVTGASRGIGRAIALRLAQEGMSVAVAARDEVRLAAVAAEIEGAGGQALVHAADLSQPEAPSRFASDALRRFGRIDLVVNNAGATVRGDFLSLTEAQWTDGFNLKFYCAVRLSRAAWPELQRTGGSIVNISGIGGLTGDAEFTIGGAVNAALMNLTKCLADRGVRDGVRVNAICPGSIATERLQTRMKKVAEQERISEVEAAATMAARLKVSRFGDPDEIASAVAFLASEASGYTQGAVLTIDGGCTRTL